MRFAQNYYALRSVRARGAGSQREVMQECNARIAHPLLREPGGVESWGRRGMSREDSEAENDGKA